jgi:hypothetical protein
METFAAQGIACQGVWMVSSLEEVQRNHTAEARVGILELIHKLLPGLV